MKHLKTYENNINDELIYIIDFDSRVDKVENLIKKGANIEYQSNNNFLLWTPLMFAIYKYRYDIIRYLIDKGANINYQDTEGTTPLMLAGDINSFEILQELIEAGADWNLKDENNCDFLDHTTDEYKEMIIEDYPEKYKNYKIKKKAEKYNI